MSAQFIKSLFKEPVSSSSEKSSAVRIPQDSPPGTAAPSSKDTLQPTSAAGGQDEPHDHTKGIQDESSDTTPSVRPSRKRSILLNMMLPPEALPVDANLALPPVVLFPPVFEPDTSVTVLDRALDTSHLQASETTTTTIESVSTSRSMLSWIRSGRRGDREGQITKRTKNVKSHEQESRTDKDGVSKKKPGAINAQTTTVVSKSTQIRTWISKVTHPYSHDQRQDVKDQGTNTSLQLQEKKEPQPQHVDQSAPPTNGSVTTVQQQGIVHQEIHQNTRSIALVNVNLSVQDVFGFGKVMEVALGMFHAHGAFLRRYPFWLQCVLMSWEGIIVLLLVWGVLRVVGLAEVVVWGADDLVRGTLSTILAIGRKLQGAFRSETGV